MGPPIAVPLHTRSHIDLRMGHESSSEEAEENGRAKRRKREKRRKKDDTDVGLKSLEEVEMDHEDILKACDEHMKKAQDEMTSSRRKRKRSSSRFYRDPAKKRK